MAWKINYSNKALKELKKLDKIQAKRILDYMDYQIAPLADPRILGKQLKGNIKNLWRYRVGNYRILCEIQDKELIIFVVTLGHRKYIYK